MASFDSLPTEIRLMILETIAAQKHRGWASTASVCKEWQSVIERRNFYQLKLGVSCLDEFERIVIRQRRLVRHIQFNVELEQYSCQNCRWLEMSDIAIANRRLVKDGIKRLFSILSTWEPTIRLILEFNAQSPSDSEHWFRDLYFNSDNEGDDNETISNWHDPSHGWIDGQRHIIPPADATRRLFEHLSVNYHENELAQVQVVECFVMRRQLRRRLSARALMHMFDKLCGLEHIIYEPWRLDGGSWSRKVIDQIFRRLLQDRLPNTVKRLSVFEDFNNDINLSSSGKLTTRVMHPRMGAAFASRSLHLEQLSASYMVNAEDFFQASMQTWTWEHLQSLTLTSQLLEPTTPHKEIYALLCSAGETALRMPKLRALTIWNGDLGNACAFIFHVYRNYAHITWRGTWELELSPRVKETWQRVAAQVYPSFPYLRVHTSTIQETIRSHGDAIHYLDLPSQVVAPASLWQIRREHVNKNPPQHDA